MAWVGVFCGSLAELAAQQADTAQPPPTPQGQKDELLKFADTAQQSFANAAHKLTQLGPPAIADGNRAQTSMVGFFTTAATAVGNRRAELAALDANDPNFAQKANQLADPGLGSAATQIQDLVSNKELAPAFGAAPECQRLTSTAAHR